MKCVIFRCSRKQEMYLYLPHNDNPDIILENVSDELKTLTGSLEKVMELELTPERKLARANVDDVIVALQEQGFYLQMPPNDILSKDDSMLYNPDDNL